MRIFLALGVGTWLLLSLFRSLPKLLPEGWRLATPLIGEHKDKPKAFERLSPLCPRFESWQRSWPILGAFYMAAGIAHFTAQQSFEAIYPPQGTWGFWALPGSATFHVAWTGVAELAGGFGLCVGATLLGLAGALGQDRRAVLDVILGSLSISIYLSIYVYIYIHMYIYVYSVAILAQERADSHIR